MYYWNIMSKCRTSFTVLRSQNIVDQQTSHKHRVLLQLKWYLRGPKNATKPVLQASSVLYRGATIRGGATKAPSPETASGLKMIYFKLQWRIIFLSGLKMRLRIENISCTWGKWTHLHPDPIPKSCQHTEIACLPPLR